MCEPATIAAVAMLAISAATAAVSHSEQEKSANRQEQAIQDGLSKDRAATARQYEQIQASAQDDQAQRYTEYLIDDARIKAVAGESGLSGYTTDRIAQENANNAETDMATLERNRQRQAEMAHTQGLASSTKGSIQLSGVRHPSSLGTGLQIAGAAASAYSSLSKPQPTPKPKP